MANTYGGVIFLGIEEKPKGRFSVTGIAVPERVLKALWDGLNNRQRISINLLTDKMVEVIEIQGKQVIRIQVPRARRAQRPVYVGQNPLTGTYRRNYEGDYLCDEETIKRMLAEQVEEVRDARLLENYGFDDIEPNTLKAYRNQYDLTKALSALVRDGFLESGGIARGTFYFFPGEPPNAEADLVAQNYKFVEKSSPEDLLLGIIPKEIFDDLKPSSDDLKPSSDDLEPSSDDLEPSSDDWQSLMAIAVTIRNKGKVSTDIMEATILRLCQGRFLNHKQLQELLDRSYNTLRLGYLSKMHKKGQLELRYPDKLTHPNQGYRTKNSSSSDF
ncbi:ATP-binding protein [Nostoc sp. PCC 7120 = FACHB-418]|uniref:Schlafen AlbA-2 domain-containing protein n=2 Tax=Nostocaceae TaxID=1162 RepID=A0A1Z4KK01_ANAVA|nr:ATP-binding protein [Anabaena cylindrica FACHB-318]MBD2267075.1 ATP-binding protein [Anabaena sp. FACHB-709]MBD2276641.1 ATP-binding protein [Nostoc sp. PCC 7120 = FACHB-418]MBD2287187.1 ATP-binding protein [Anabaena cylindrica FACHB-170]MBD2352882.1 ATP-binding protein [Trichormus variabilis FACHB-171]BAY69254.1 hypothetical protein NIES23_20480 [Trichormus variabilis NIES-23]HBW32318.1 ATP-binding protein [Nostoc sp. UBA8866]